MKLFATIAATAALVLGAATVQAQTYEVEPYVGGSFGGNFMEGDRHADGVTVGVEGGVQVDTFRGELAYDYNDADGNNDQMVSGMVYVDVHNESQFTPYVGAGLGHMWQEDHDDEFTYILSTGVSAELNPDLDLDVQYRYVDGLDSSSNEIKERHLGTVGLRYRF